MRPDEHKKKKNAQYKSKHGISNKKQTQEKDLQSTKAKDDKVKDKDRKKEGRETTSTADTGLPSTSGTFSNWHRYEMDSDEEETDNVTVQRGEDFSKLLSMAGPASAQFKFKDEEDWDGGTESLTTASSNILSVDLSSVAEKLQTLPVYQRLDLDASLFDSTDFSEHKQSESAPQECLLDSVYDDKHSVDSVSLELGLQAPECESSGSTNNNTCMQFTHKQKGTVAKDEEDISVENNILSSANRNTSRRIDISDFETDLDSMLSTFSSVEENHLPRNLGVNININKGSCSDQSYNKNTSIQKHSTKIKDNSDTVAEVSKAKSDPSVSSKLNGAEKSELEDWLDSVLDD